MKIAAHCMSFLILSLVTKVSSLGVFNKGRAPAGKAFQTTDEALGIYLTAYPRKEGEQRSFNAAWGMPVKDIDNTEFKIAKDDKLGKTFSDVDESDLKSTYQELCKVYDEEVALKMVKDVPLVLAATRTNFQPSLKAFIEIFGEEDARAMVARNPGLLFVKPADAAKAEDLTMKMSYAVSITRPLGPFLLFGLLALLCEPLFETVSGIPLKATIFGGL